MGEFTLPDFYNVARTSICMEQKWTIYMYGTKMNKAFTLLHFQELIGHGS